MKSYGRQANQIRIIAKLRTPATPTSKPPALPFKLKQCDKVPSNVFPPNPHAGKRLSES